MKNNGGRTALHYAASKGWVKVAELLLSNGAKINAKDKVCNFIMIYKFSVHLSNNNISFPLWLLIV